jgi:hypothetical protein
MHELESWEHHCIAAQVRTKKACNTLQDNPARVVIRAAVIFLPTTREQESSHHKSLHKVKLALSSYSGKWRIHSVSVTANTVQALRHR